MAVAIPHSLAWTITRFAIGAEPKRGSNRLGDREVARVRLPNPTEGHPQHHVADPLLL